MIENQNFGGNDVKHFKSGFPGKTTLASGSYEYFIYETLENEVLNFTGLGSFTIYIFYKSEGAFIVVDELLEKPQQGDCIQIENCPVVLKISGGIVKLLIAGTSAPHPTLKGLFFTKHADIYKVEKPWGFELWINEEHPCYAFKKIFIKAGTKTSLQYHNFKKETNVFFQGTAKLHYKRNPMIANDLVTNTDMAYTVLEPVSVLDVVPKTLHRVEAITDITTFETSTPQLDDVIRLQDDSNRANGKLLEEHVIY